MCNEILHRSKVLQLRKYNKINLQVYFFCLTVPSYMKPEKMSIKKGATVVSLDTVGAIDSFASNEEILPMFSSITNLSSTVKRTMEEMSQVRRELLQNGRRGDVVYDLRATTRNMFKITVVGSRAYGLGFRNSDYDVTFELSKNSSNYTEEDTLYMIKEYIVKNEDFLVVGLRNLRVKYLKLLHRRTKLHCDISIWDKRNLGLENTLLTRAYLSDDRIRFVATAVKLWAKSLDLFCEKRADGRITCFGILWLVLFSLMRTDPPVALPVVTMRDMKRDHEDFYDGWDFSIKPISTEANHFSEIDLLRHFFKFYGSVSSGYLHEHVLSPYLGVAIPKGKFFAYNSLPSEYSDYKKLVDLEPSRELNLYTPLCLQHPVDHTENLQHSIKVEQLERLLMMCRRTEQLLSRIS